MLLLLLLVASRRRVSPCRLRCQGSTGRIRHPRCLVRAPLLLLPSSSSTPSSSSSSSSSSRRLQPCLLLVPRNTFILGQKPTSRPSGSLDGVFMPGFVEEGLAFRNDPPVILQPRSGFTSLHDAFILLGVDKNGLWCQGGRSCRFLGGDQGFKSFRVCDHGVVEIDAPRAAVPEENLLLLLLGRIISHAAAAATTTTTTVASSCSHSHCPVQGHGGLVLVGVGRLVDHGERVHGVGGSFHA